MPTKQAYVFSLIENRAIDISTGGVEALRDGKSLHMSDHVHDVQYQGIGESVPYCFLRASDQRNQHLSGTL